MRQIEEEAPDQIQASAAHFQSAGLGPLDAPRMPYSGSHISIFWVSMWPRIRCSTGISALRVA